MLKSNRRPDGLPDGSPDGALSPSLHSCPQRHRTGRTNTPCKLQCWSSAFPLHPRTLRMCAIRRSSSCSLQRIWKPNQIHKFPLRQLWLVARSIRFSQRTLSHCSLL